MSANLLIRTSVFPDDKAMVLNIIKDLSSEIALRVSMMFNDAIFGDNATILIGDRNQQTVTNQIVKGDFETLKSLLKERNVPPTDIDELRSAIEADANSEDVKAKRFGPRVRGWIKSMLSKAVDTSWQVEIGIASNLLTDALKAYYGW